jgi:hypothetical protein
MVSARREERRTKAGTRMGVSIESMRVRGKQRWRSLRNHLIARISNFADDML